MILLLLQNNLKGFYFYYEGKYFIHLASHVNPDQAHSVSRFTLYEIRNRFLESSFLYLKFINIAGQLITNNHRAGHYIQMIIQALTRNSEWPFRAL